MTEKETEKEVLWKQKKRTEALFLILIGLGVVLIVFGMISGMNVWLIDDDHITDPSMPISEKDNVTYTWTTEELRSQFEKSYPLMFVGLGMFFAGYAVQFVTIGDKKFHRVHCPPIEGPDKYCSECGLRLSRLERD